jgi:lambda repressor-like predicted transcriptional regulator
MTSNKTEFNFESMFRDMNLVWGQQRKWDKDDIIAEFDSTNITLSELSRKSGWTIAELKSVLLA